MATISFANVFHGKGNKRQYSIYVVLVLAFFIIMCLISQAVFPNGYNPVIHMISAQGNSVKNPQGYLFFVFGTAITGILLIPYIVYLGRSLSPNCKIGRIFMEFAGILGCIGFTLVGIVRENFQPYHDGCTGIAFGGFALFAILIFCNLFWRIGSKKIWPKPQFLLIFVPNVLLLIGVILYGLGIIHQINDIPTFWYHQPIWEWSALVNVTLFLICVMLIIPKNANKDMQ